MSISIIQMDGQLSTTADTRTHTVIRVTRDWC